MKAKVSFSYKGTTITVEPESTSQSALSELGESVEKLKRWVDRMPQEAEP